MFGSADVAAAAGDSGVALTTPSGSVAAATWAWAFDVEARVAVAVKTVKATTVSLCLFDMPRVTAAGVPTTTPPFDQRCCCPVHGRICGAIVPDRADERRPRPHPRVQAQHRFWAIGVAITPC